MIVTVGGIKGGGGKTTVATNLAVWLSNQNTEVLLVDSDHQESATDITTSREQTLGATGYTAIRLSGENVRRQLLNLKPKYDHIVIDTGGQDTTSQRAALTVSDIYLVPFVPRSIDLWTITKVEGLLEEIRTVNEDLRAYAFLNRADGRGSDNQEAAEVLKGANGIQFLEPYLGNRKAFPNASGKGLSVLELAPLDLKAARELNELFSLIFHNLNQSDNGDRQKTRSKKEGK